MEDPLAKESDKRNNCEDTIYANNLVEQLD